MGLLTIGLVAVTFWCDPRHWVRNLSIGCLALVLFQGGLGGARVLMDEITLAVLAAIVYLIILERRESHKMSAREDVEGITTFHISRDSLPPLDRLLRKAKKEIILYAVQHSHLVHQCLGILREKAEAGCRVRVLMMAPRGPDGR